MSQSYLLQNVSQLFKDTEKNISLLSMRLLIIFQEERVVCDVGKRLRGKLKQMIA